MTGFIEDQILPITPDFAGFLNKTPRALRSGRVFRPLGKTIQILKSEKCVIKRISDIGKKAGIKVSDKKGKIKYASAHDLRRSFGLRWSKRVMPAVLMAMMRHKDISTTMKFYVGQDAESMAETIWKTESLDTSLDTSQKQQSAQEIN